VQKKPYSDESSPSSYQKRWKVEEDHKSLKHNAALAKSPTKLPHTQHNHIFASIVGFLGSAQKRGSRKSEGCACRLG
jgi:hypothetical protein